MGPWIWLQRAWWTGQLPLFGTEFIQKLVDRRGARPTKNLLSKNRSITIFTLVAMIWWAGVSLFAKHLDGYPAIITVGVMAVFLLYPLWLLCFSHVVEAKARRKARQHRFLLCCRCMYPLKGVATSGNCPECGDAFTTLSTRESWVRNHFGTVRWWRRLRRRRSASKS